jgi:hypothetical protein
VNLTKPSPAIGAFLLVALCVIAIAVLAALGVNVPEILSTVALVALGGGAGVALPGASTTTLVAPVTPEPAPAPLTVPVTLPAPGGVGII